MKGSWRVTVGLVVMVGLMAGCGGEETTGNLSAETSEDAESEDVESSPSPEAEPTTESETAEGGDEAYATVVCDVFVPFFGQADSLDDDFNQLLLGNAPAEELKAGLLTFVQGLGQEASNAIGQLESIPPPSVEGGDAIQQDLLAALGTAQGAIKDIESKVPGLPTNSQDAFLQALIEVGESFEGSVPSGADAAMYNQVPALEPLLKDAPECASIQGKLDGTEP